MTAWEALAVSQPHLAKFINAGLQKLREGYNKMDLTRAYVMALGEFLHPQLQQRSDRSWGSAEPSSEVFAHQEALGH